VKLELQLLSHFVNIVSTLSRNKVLCQPRLLAGVPTDFNQESIENYVSLLLLSGWGLARKIEFRLARPVNERLLLMCFQYVLVFVVVPNMEDLLSTRHCTELREFERLHG